MAFLGVFLTRIEFFIQDIQYSAKNAFPGESLTLWFSWLWVVVVCGVIGLVGVGTYVCSCFSCYYKIERYVFLRMKPALPFLLYI